MIFSTNCIFILSFSLSITLYEVKDWGSPGEDVVHGEFVTEAPRSIARQSTIQDTLLGEVRHVQERVRSEDRLVLKTCPSTIEWITIKVNRLQVQMISIETIRRETTRSRTRTLHKIDPYPDDHHVRLPRRLKHSQARISKVGNHERAPLTGRQLRALIDPRYLRMASPREARSPFIAPRRLAATSIKSNVNSVYWSSSSRLA